MVEDVRPLYTISTAAELLGIHPRTLRLYEQARLMRPARRNNRRLYTNHDLKWAMAIRLLIHEKGLNQEGLRRLLATIPCWEILHCPPEQTALCAAYQNMGKACWELASEDCANGHQECYRCEVYLSAPARICTPEELAEIEQRTAELI
ncbi:MAG: MerR family transcriptional regulator [Chloroflexi bacterium]|nr:MerR family transcriptional regulator [Chloroflexota bacterium]